MDKRRIVTRILMLLAVLALVGSQPAPTLADPPPGPYFQGFEDDIDGWFTPIRVASGSNGIPSRSGAYHAEVPANSGAFTRWGGYGGSSFPADGYLTRVAIFLNVDGGYENKTQADWSSAINNETGAHRRDFIFSIGFFNDSTSAPVAGGVNRFIVSASNNTPGWPDNPGRSPIAITDSGWYVFQHHFHDRGDGTLAVGMSVIAPNGTTVGAWTLSDATDVIGATIGANRYGWFPLQKFSFLAVDDSERVGIEVNTETISNVDPKDWGFSNDGHIGSSSGAFDLGPAVPPLGQGSVRLEVGDTAGGYLIGRAYPETALSDIIKLSYSTYRELGDAPYAPALQFNVDYDLADAVTTWQGRLVFEPYYTQTVNTGMWQTWNPLAGKWWATGLPGKTACPQSAPCTWSQIRTAFPRAGIHATLGGILFKVGSNWGPTVAYVDAFTIGTSAGIATYDFEFVDATPPTITQCASPQSAYADGSGTAAVPDFTTSVTATDDVTDEANLLITQAPLAGTLFGVGVHPVTITVADEAGNEATCSTTFTVLGVQDAKASILTDLQALRATVTDREDGRRLDQAIAQLRQSLHPSLWDDPLHPDPKRGSRVFQEEKDSVIKLIAIVRDRKSTIDDAIILGFINRIVSADRLLAQVAINDAAGGSAKELAKANRELLKGDARAADGRFTSAIEHYRNAWKHALHASKKLTEHCGDRDDPEDDDPRGHWKRR